MEQQNLFEFEPRPTIKGFPELRWTGKRPFKATQYFPAQLKESYGEPVKDWMNKIFWGDNLQVMSHLLKEFRGQVDLIYIVISSIISSGIRSKQGKPFFSSQIYLAKAA